MLTATAAAKRASAASLWDRVAAAAVRPVAADSAAAFRIAFGVIVAFSSIRFVLKGWVGSLYLAPAHHLTYPGFGWVHPWPAPLMYAHVLGLAVLGACIAIGYRSRAATILFALGFAYVELIDAALYLNHYWFVTLTAVLLAVLPVHERSAAVPAITVWALRAQVGAVYVFAGLAKLNADWLLYGLPLRLWLPVRSQVPVVGALLTFPFTASVLSWVGALFDCTIVGWLLWRRSRPYAFAGLVVFHLVTAVLFPIGVFPWLMIGASLIFFSPDWPARLRGRSLRPPPVTVGPPARVSRRLIAFLFVFALVQVAVPLRHLAYPGDVRFTDEGYYGSWRVMLTEKDGWFEFRLRADNTGRELSVDPHTLLTDWQYAQAAARPDLLLAAAHLVAEEYHGRGFTGVKVYADAFVSFMGRPAQRFVDPTVDLAAVRRTLGHQTWILSEVPR